MRVMGDSSHRETKSGWTRSAQDAAETQGAELSSPTPPSRVTPKTSGDRATVSVTKLRSSGISSSPTRIDVRYTFRPPLSNVAVALLLTASVLIAGQFVFVAIMLAVLAALLAINYASIRLTADEGGVRVMNWGSKLLAWSEISEIKLGRSWGSQIIEISLWNGQKVKPWATRTGAMGGYPYEQIDRVVQRLQVMLRRERGIKDPPALADALAAAEECDPQPIDHLLASGTIDRATYSQRLHELCRRGEDRSRGPPPGPPRRALASPAMAVVVIDNQPWRLASLVLGRSSGPPRNIGPGLRTGV